MRQVRRGIFYICPKCGHNEVLQTLNMVTHYRYKTDRPWSPRLVRSYNLPVPGWTTRCLCCGYHEHEQIENVESDKITEVIPQ